MKTKLGDILTVLLLLTMCIATGYVVSLNQDAINNPTTHWSKP